MAAPSCRGVKHGLDKDGHYKDKSISVSGSPNGLETKWFYMWCQVTVHAVTVFQAWKTLDTTIRELHSLISTFTLVKIGVKMMWIRGRAV